VESLGEVGDEGKGRENAHGAHAPLNERAFEPFSIADKVLRYGTPA